MARVLCSLFLSQRGRTGGVIQEQAVPYTEYVVGVGSGRGRVYLL